MRANKYFDPSEFDSPDQPGSGAEMMQDIFIERLTFAREIAGIPFHINSGYRSPAHNRAVRGVPNSAHTKGYGADIRARDRHSRFLILTALLTAGFNRIGIARTYIHVDNDPSRGPQVCWLY